MNAAMCDIVDISPTMPMLLYPSKSAPITTKIAIRMVAVLYVKTLAATPVPKILAESLLPRPQPRNTPPMSVHTGKNLSLQKSDNCE
jgi:hypothetical protein